MIFVTWLLVDLIFFFSGIFALVVSGNRRGFNDVTGPLATRVLSTGY